MKKNNDVTYQWTQGSLKNKQEQEETQEEEEEDDEIQNILKVKNFA